MVDRSIVPERPRSSVPRQLQLRHFNDVLPVEFEAINRRRARNAAVRDVPRGQIRPLEGTGEAPVEGGPTGELRLECGEILEVDVEPGIGETPGGASLQTGDANSGSRVRPSPAIACGQAS